MSALVKLARRRSRRKKEKKLTATKKKDERTMNGFIIGPTLGIGGYAVVVLGKDKKTGEKVALKVLKADKEGKISESKKKQTRRAIDLLTKVKHENVLRLVRHDTDAEFPEKNGTKTKCIMMALEHAPSGELFDYLMYTGNFDDIVSRSYFQQLIEGLDAIHKAGYTHRDLKPENLLLDAQYRLKIADFGFASSQQKMRTACGTKGYLAPELLKGSKYSQSIDVFAAGIILFIMYAGFPPFNDAIASDWWWNRLENGWKERDTQILLDKKKDWSRHGLFWAAHERSHKFPEDMKDFLLKVLHWDPRKRPAIDDIRDKDRVYFITPQKLYGRKEADKKGKENRDAGLSWYQKPVKSSKDLGKYLEKRRKQVFRERAKKVAEQQLEHDVEQGLVAKAGDKDDPFDPQKETIVSYMIRRRYADLCQKIDPKDDYFESCIDLDGDSLFYSTPFFFFTEYEPSIVAACFETVARQEGARIEHEPNECRMTIRHSLMKAKSRIKLEAEFEVSVHGYADKYIVSCKRLRGDPLAFKEIIGGFWKAKEIVQITHVDENDTKDDADAAAAPVKSFQRTLEKVPDLEAN